MGADLWNDDETITELGLALAESFKGASSELQGITVGVVRFQGWQLHQLAVEPDTFDGAKAFLIQVNYDVDFDLAAPAPARLRVGFDLETEGVTFMDIVPRHVDVAEGPRLYGVSAHLAFEPASAAGITATSLASVTLPAVRPHVEVLGVGGRSVWWVHTPPPRQRPSSGSHTGWFTLLVPAECAALRVRALADFDCPEAGALDMEPVSAVATVTIVLPAPRRSNAGVRIRAIGEGAGEGMRTRLGFNVDTEGSSKLPDPARVGQQARLLQVVTDAIEGTGVPFADVQWQPTGDGMNAFLPDVDLTRALPALLNGLVVQLRRDNEHARDRMRVRMAVDVGPVGLAPLGFAGTTILRFYRLADSKVLRKLLDERPTIDLALLLSDKTYADYVEPGYPGLEPNEFRRVQARSKGFQAPAWIWEQPVATTHDGPG